MSDLWRETMDAITAEAQAAGLEFYEVRNEVGNRCVEADRDFYEGHGVTASDMNHMLYGRWQSDPDEVRQVIKELVWRKEIMRTIEEQGICPNTLAKLFEPM